MVISKDKAKALTSAKKPKNRKMLAVSCNPVEQETIELLMAKGGYTSFTEFAKARLLGDASEAEKRFRTLENEVANLRAGYERHHALWVDTVKSVAGTDIEALLAAVFELVWLGSRGADRAQVARNIDVKKITQIIENEHHGYR